MALSMLQRPATALQHGIAVPLEGIESTANVYRQPRQFGCPPAMAHAYTPLHAERYQPSLRNHAAQEYSRIRPSHQQERKLFQGMEILAHQ